MKNNIAENPRIDILIPCYNWNVYEFIHKIHALCQHEDGLNQFEIICIEDASPMLFANQQINGLQYVKYEKLNKNIGRSRIRNLMAKKAQYEWLLFIDADSKLSDNFFIKKYIQAIQQNDTCENIIFYGGTLYLKKQPEKDKILHWKYGTKIESKRKKECFSSHHFLIQKIEVEVFVNKAKVLRSNLAFQIAKKNGICAISVFNSTHPGAMSSIVTNVTQNNLIGIGFTNADPLILSYNGKESFFGTISSQYFSFR